MKHKIASDSFDRKRWYNDACSAAFGLDLVGERWSLLIMRELLFGPRRFTELKNALSGISANILTQRLKSLEADGILVRSDLPESPSVHVYELTDWGYEIEPVIVTLGRWALRHPDHDPEMPLSPVSLMMALQIMFSPEKAEGTELRAGLKIGADQFLVHIKDGDIVIERAATIEADVIFAGSTRMLGAILVGSRSLTDAESLGRVEVSGNRANAERFFELFETPRKTTV